MLPLTYVNDSTWGHGEGGGGRGGGDGGQVLVRPEDDPEVPRGTSFGRRHPQGTRPNKMWAASPLFGPPHHTRPPAGSDGISRTALLHISRLCSPTCPLQSLRGESQQNDPKSNQDRAKREHINTEPANIRYIVYSIQHILIPIYSISIYSYSL